MVRRPSCRLCLSVLAVVGIVCAAVTRVPQFTAAAAPKTSTKIAAGDVAPEHRYERQIKPLLAKHCLQCHGPDKAEGGLNLLDRKSALKELESGSIGIVPGKPEASELLARISSHDESTRMPPEGKPLTAAEIEVFKTWITEGAEYQTHWAYRPLALGAPPKIKNTAAVRNPIDAFVVAKLESKQIAPSPEASRETLIKRLYFDLLGLLPTPEEVDAFVRDKSPGAYENLVDRLLASPHFGERWGRHWLDMARYADSDGYEKDRARPDAYVFRDWVINAYNTDMPFDRFTIEQIAGDLLPNATPSQKIATAFNRQTLTNEEGGVDQEEYRVNAVFDRTDTLGTVWLGLTLGCAKCHNHKYDEISQAEYYKMFAYFNDADEVLTRLPVKATDAAALEKKLQPLEQALEKRKRELAPLQAKWEDEQREIVENRPNAKLEYVHFTDVSFAAASGLAFTEDKKLNIFTAAPKPGAAPAATDTYTLTIAGLPSAITGLRIDTLPDKAAKAKGAGHSKNGNFVITNLRANVVDKNGKLLRAIPLQRATADFEQSGFKATDVLTETPNKKKGWAVLPKVDADHWLQVRTTAPVTFAKGERLQVVIEQAYGSQHTLNRFKVRAVTGDARELHLPPDVAAALRMYPEKRIALTRATLFNFYVGLDPQVAKLQKDIEATLAEFKAQMMPVRTIATSIRGRETHRFERGDFLSPAELLTPATLHVVPKGASENGSPKKSNDVSSTGGTPAQFVSNGKASAAEEKTPRSTRLDLAHWLVSRENPLTPRVVVNQIWARLFGIGIVRSINDFGARGDLPSHPELLDWLAGQYQRDLKWSTKSLLKTILMSATYRQSSAHRPELVDVDPQNVLLARQNRLRVEGEIVRDLALCSAGLLSRKIGGPSVFPPMPPELAKLSYAGSFSWTDSTGEDRYRRGMYTFFKRTIPHPTLMTFDCPDANIACVNRTVSNTPLQALTLLNNESFVEASQALAKRLLTEEPAPAGAKPQAVDTARLGEAMRQCLARTPRPDELDRLDTLLDNARAYYRDHPEEAEQMIGRYTAPTVANAEVAAWTATVRVLLNLDEFITRE